MSKAEPGAGDVTIRLGGKDVVLRPSVEACIAISKMAGNSLNVAMARIIDRLDFEFIVDVVALGIGETSPHLKKQITQAVYEQGVINIAADVILYVRTVMNGGKLPADDRVERSIEYIETLLHTIPDDMREQAGALEDLHRALIAKLGEAGSEAEDPLPASKSPSGNGSES